MNRSLSERRNWKAKSKQEIDRAFERLSNDIGLSMAKIAEAIGRSPSSVSEWRAKKVQPKDDDAIKIGVLAAGKANPEDLVNYWLALFGYSGKYTADRLKQKITQACSFSAAIIDSVKNLKGKAVDRGILEDHVSLIVSCYTAQQPLLERIKRWRREQATAGGTSCFFWRWHKGILRRVQMGADGKHHADLHRYYEQMITPAEEVVEFWEGRELPSFRLHGFLLVGSDEHLGNVEKLLRADLEKFVQSMRWTASDKERFRFWVAQYDYPHVTDSWVFTSKEMTFGALVSENTELVEKMEASADPEIQRNPYPYCSQVVLLEAGGKLTPGVQDDYQETLKKEFEERYDVDFTSKRVETDGPQPLKNTNWKELSFRR